MARNDQPDAAMGLVRPGRALTGAMIVLGAVWLMFAIAVNWAGGSEEVFLLFCGSTERILEGEIWRLFTAPLMHVPSGTISHILFAVLGLFFLAPTLEARWGGPRMLRFLALSSLLAYLFQMACELILPASIARLLVPEYWFGAFPAIEAVAVAWALNFQGQTVRLFLVVPVTARTLLLFIVGMSLLRIVALSPGSEGLLSPIGGMIAGWALGGGTPSPLRRAYLKLRLAQLDRESRGDRGGGAKGGKKRGAPLRVIEGGRRDGRGPGGGMLH